MTHLRPLLIALLLATAACMTPLGDPAEDGSASTESLYAYQRYVWPGPSIPVCWLDMDPAQAIQRQWVRQAVARTWEAHSQVVFVGWGSCAGVTGPAVRIRVVDERARAVVGHSTRAYTGEPTMWLNLTHQAYPCYRPLQECVEWTAIHEFGHALGFAHEQNRHDTPQACRDQLLASGDPWAIQPTDPRWEPLTLGAWDPDSVMNYCGTEWNNHGQLTATDIAGLQALYLSPDLREAALLWPRFYLARNPDIAPFYPDPASAITHYRAFGRAEGREASPLFDPTVYLALHPDLQAAFGPHAHGAAVQHWTDAGHREGRRTSLVWGPADYFGFNPDLQAPLGNDPVAGLQHYLSSGIAEGRRASWIFDPSYYRAAHPDLAHLDNAELLMHFALHGIHEGRRGSAEFDPHHYLHAHADLLAAFGPGGYEQAAIHWLATGHRETWRTTTP